MKTLRSIGWLCVGLAVGAVTMGYFGGSTRVVHAGNDRAEDCILCTGPVVVDARNRKIDGIWLLDYRAGKLKGTIIDQITGKTLPWKEVDLVQEFGILPKQNVHFLMTTGIAVNGQTTVLYVAETLSGKFGVYTMAPLPDLRMGVQIFRHDLTNFRTPPVAN